jgi:O-methyltransferase
MASGTLPRFPPSSTAPAPAAAQALYLDLLKKCLTRSIFAEGYQVCEPRRGTWKGRAFAPAGRALAARGLQLMRRVPHDPALRAEGGDWPAEAETMVGLRRLDNLEHCITDLHRREVPGDLIETGVWRGGATIFMRAVLKTLGDDERLVWAADSFAGLPRPDPEHYPADARDLLWSCPQLAVPLEEVRANFARYGLLDGQVRFLPGWFRDTLPSAPIERLALLRVDGDLYESTTIALRALYPKLSVGGFVIVDDYALPGCRAAVDDFRAEHGVTEEFERVDWACVFWRRR